MKTTYEPRTIGARVILLLDCDRKMTRDELMAAYVKKHGSVLEPEFDKELMAMRRVGALRKDPNGPLLYL